MTKLFKILCFYEPSFFACSSEYARPDLNVKEYFGRFVADDLLQFDNVEVKTIVPSILGHRNRMTHVFDYLSPIEISEQELFGIFRGATSLASIYLSIYNSSYSETERFEYEALLRSKLQGWEPDLIVTYPIHNNIVRGLYPTAPCLQMECGIFSRFPAPPSVKFDPIHYANAFAHRYKAEIGAIKLSTSQREVIDRFVAELRQIFKPDRETVKRLGEYRKQYKHIVLLPILASNAYKESDCDDQMAFMHHVMSMVPKDIGVIVTFHDTVSSQINSETIKYLQSRHPNIIYFPHSPTAISTAASINFFSQVDAVLNCCSMTGVQALVFGTRMVALDKRYSHGFADRIGLDGLAQFLDQTPPDHSSVIYWLLSHGTVFGPQLRVDDIRKSYFYRLVESYRANGVTYDLFQQTQSVEAVTRYILDTIRLNIQVTKITRYIPTPILFVERKIRKLFARQDKQGKMDKRHKEKTLC